MTKEQIRKELRTIKYVRLVADKDLNDLNNGLTYVEINTEEFINEAMLQIELYNLSKIKSLFVDAFVIAPIITEYPKEYFVSGYIEITINFNVPKASYIHNERKENIHFGCIVYKED